MKGPVKDRLGLGLYDRMGDERFFPTVGTAVEGYLAGVGHGVGRLGGASRGPERSGGPDRPNAPPGRGDLGRSADARRTVEGPMRNHPAATRNR